MTGEGHLGSKRMRGNMRYLPVFLELMTDESDDDSVFEMRRTAIGRAETIPLLAIGNFRIRSKYVGSS